MPKCTTCKADIEFYRTATGRTMPIDPIPVSDGNLWLIDNVITSIPKTVLEDDGVAIDPEDNPGNEKRQEEIKRPRYKSHFATCSAAEFYRKRK